MQLRTRSNKDYQLLDSSNQKLLELERTNKKSVLNDNLRVTNESSQNIESTYTTKVSINTACVKTEKIKVLVL